MTANVTLAETYEQLQEEYYIHKLDTHPTAKANIERAIIIETVFSSISTINLPPTIKPMTKKINNGRNLKLPNPFCICI